MVGVHYLRQIRLVQCVQVSVKQGIGNTLVAKIVGMKIVSVIKRWEDA